MAEDQIQMLELMIKVQMIVPGKVRIVDLEGAGTVALEIDGEHYMPVLEWMRRKRTHDRSTGYSWEGDPASDEMIRARDVVEEATITRRPLTAAEQTRVRRTMRRTPADGEEVYGLNRKVEHDAMASCGS